MSAHILLFALGVLLLQHSPQLPPPAWLAPLPLCGLAALGLRRRWTAAGRVLLWLAAFGLGLGWAALRAEWRLADALDPALEGVPVVVDGVVAGLPEVADGRLRFVFQVEQGPPGVPRRLLLSGYSAPHEPPRAAERWRLQLRLRRPHGGSNPHTFDYSGWLLQQGLRATGSVRGGERLGDAELTPLLRVQRLRQAIRERVEGELGGHPARGLLLALAIGDDSAISAAQWRVLRDTGVAHAVSVSGLHISLVALFAGGIANWLWRRRAAWVLRCPARTVGMLAGVVAAGGYALLAGLEVPALRAWIMLAVGAWAWHGGRFGHGGEVLALALLAVLLADPWAVLAAGFWLSFGAVALILFALAGHLRPPPAWRAALWVQLILSLALAPLLLWLFGRFPLVSPLANGLAVPLVSAVLTPLMLLYLLLPWAPLLQLAAWVGEGLFAVLGWLAALPGAVWVQAVPPWPLLAAALPGLLWLLLPRGTPARPAALLLVLPALLWQPPRPAPGEFHATVLDVGQGLAVHVRTAGHDLLYDAGPAWRSGSDAGERIVLPYLQGEGVAALDLLLLSHDDVDHTGGAAAIGEGLRVRALADSLPAGRLPASLAGAARQPCVAGRRWRFDGVLLELLHPPPGASPAPSDNARSCVLRVAGRHAALLLTGDIGRAEEAGLAQALGAGPASQVVVAPHHGSRSSSGPELVGASRASHVIYAAGHRNAFGHPHPEVWARWARAGALGWRTDTQGAIRVEAGAAGLRVTPWRERQAAYWHWR